MSAILLWWMRERDLVLSHFQQMTQFPWENSALLTWNEKNKYNKGQYAQLLRAAFPMVLPSESSNPTHTGAKQQYPLINLELSLQPPGFGPLWRSKALSGIVFTHQIEEHGTSSTRNCYLSTTLLIMVLASTLEPCAWRDAEEDHVGQWFSACGAATLCDAGSHVWKFWMFFMLAGKLFRARRQKKVERFCLI